MSLKIISYSDLHLEFRHQWSLPLDIDGDVLILAGDIMTFYSSEDFAAWLGEARSVCGGES